MSKSRSWTFPTNPSPAVGAAPAVPFAGCQPSFLAFLCLTFLCAAGEEAASLREEDSDGNGEDAVEGEEVCAAVLEVRCTVFEVHGSFLEVHCCVLEIRCSLEVQCSEGGRIPSSASPH